MYFKFFFAPEMTRRWGLIRERILDIRVSAKGRRNRETPLRREPGGARPWFETTEFFQKAEIELKSSGPSKSSRISEANHDNQD